MKKLATLIFIIMMFILASSNALASYPNEPDGFRGIKWGTDITDLKETLQFIGRSQQSPDKSFYKRVDDIFVIGASQISSITYCFWLNKFYMVIIETTGYTNWLDLTIALETKFGLSNDQTVNNYYWFGGSTGIVTSYNEVSKEGKTFFFSENIRKQSQEWDRKQAIIGTQKGF